MTWEQMSLFTDEELGVPMSYEELFKKVEGFWHDSFKSKAWSIVWDIIKFHKPFDFTIGEESFTACRCNEMYPCPTIQAIEAELK